jgi:TATA-box binding protein (TBP) (component of TFIID and TFIIIB)
MTWSGTRLAKEPTISNYKVSFRTDTPLRKAVRELLVGDCTCCANVWQQPDGSCVCSVKLLHNFAVVRTCRHVYTLNDSGFVNITKLVHLSDVGEAVNIICKLVKLPERNNYAVTVDNVTASGAFGCPIPLHKLSQHLTANVEKLAYRPNYFSGASVKYHGGGGTIILFTTGAFTIVGAKSEQQVWHLYQQTQTLLSQVA